MSDPQQVLTLVALDARDAWRNLIPKLDAATTPAAAQELLREVRELAVLHGERLRVALLEPVRNASQRGG